jgi:type II secretory pathway component PulJ
MSCETNINLNLSHSLLLTLQVLDQAQRAARMLPENDPDRIELERSINALRSQLMAAVKAWEAGRYPSDN